MSYLQFLLIFLGLPLAALASLSLWDKHQGRKLPLALRNWSPALAILAHIGVALLYTTPWDNYVVATGVWWYDPRLVTAAPVGWAPLEEYLFFILQPLVAGLWLVYLARRLPVAPELEGSDYSLRWLPALVMGLLWLGSLGLLLSGWQPGTYLGLALAWALPPLIFQVAFGGDILWRHRRLSLIFLLSTTLYLSAVDIVALQAGTWTIDPAQSLAFYLGGLLPVEELIFFLLTNLLLSFGMILVLARQSQERLSSAWQQRFTKIGPLGNN